MANPLEVRLTIAGMRAGIIQYLHADYMPQLDAAIRAELDRALAAFDFEAEVRRSIAEVLPVLVRQHLQTAISAVLDEEFATSALNDLVRAAITGALRERRA